MTTDSFLGENEMANQFNLGETVVLKSGGPKMTVVKVGEDSFHRQRVWCEFFDGNKKISDTFVPESLEQVD
jgi:uncharacterized protein YodC (DUF2158 family)